MTVNRRLDEWVEIERLDLSNKLEDPHCKIKDMSIMMTDLSDGTDRKITRNQKRKHDEINHVQKVCSCTVIFKDASYLYQIGFTESFKICIMVRINR